ncbi:MAG: MOSC domain-containing protein [Cohaesibacteraceae bacterium]
MAESLKALIERIAQPGRLEWIGLRPERRASVINVEQADVAEAGLVGDRSRAGKRAITLIQHEHLASIGAYIGQEAIDPSLLRRNLVVSGINLLALKERTIQIGSATLAVTGPCAPCSRMEEALGPGGYSAMRGHGGVTASVVAGGIIKVGDQVTALPT